MAGGRQRGDAALPLLFQPSGSESSVALPEARFMKTAFSRAPVGQCCDNRNTKRKNQVKGVLIPHEPGLMEAQACGLRREATGNPSGGRTSPPRVTRRRGAGSEGLPCRRAPPFRGQFGRLRTPTTGRGSPPGRGVAARSVSRDLRARPARARFMTSSATVRGKRFRCRCRSPFLLRAEKAGRWPDFRLAQKMNFNASWMLRFPLRYEEM